MGQECGSGLARQFSFRILREVTAGKLAGLWSLNAPLGWKTSFPHAAVGRRPQSVPGGSLQTGQLTSHNYSESTLDLL